MMVGSRSGAWRKRRRLAARFKRPPTANYYSAAFGVERAPSRIS